MGLIYSLSFSDGKQYIGLTRQKIGRRLANHRMFSKKVDRPLYRAWREFGEPICRVLAIVENEDLGDTEKRAIKAYGTLAPNGYNCTSGGQGGGNCEETSRKMSLAGKGKPKSEAHRAAIAKGQLGRPGTWSGKKHSPEHVASRASAHRGLKRSEEFKARMSVLAKGRKYSPETIAKRIETQRRNRAARQLLI